MFLKLFQNHHSNAIDVSIPVLLSTLIDTYRRVSEDALQDEANLLRTKVFDIIEPLVIMDNEMDDLQELAIAAHLEYSKTQLLNICLQKKYESLQKRADRMV